MTTANEGVNHFLKKSNTAAVRSESNSAQEIDIITQANIYIIRRIVALGFIFTVIFAFFGNRAHPETMIEFRIAVGAVQGFGVAIATVTIFYWIMNVIDERRNIA